MAPKSLLRHPMVISSFNEIGPGTTIQYVIPDETANPGKVKKVLLCTGKVYYDLFAEREEKHLQDKIAIVRIEQLCPFPYHHLAQEMMKYPRAKVRSFPRKLCMSRINKHIYFFFFYLRKFPLNA